MNERIKQIAEECGLYIAYDNREVTNKELAYFAELIVKECIQIVDGTPFGYMDYRDQIEEGMRSACVDRLMEHFGVKD